MSIQLTMRLEVHERENSAINEAFLKEHKSKFSNDCFEVLKRVVKGDRLTVKGAMMEGLTNSLPRRILDLKEYGFEISTEWKGKGKSKYIEYFMSDSDKSKAAEVLLQKMKAA